jgi:anthranilate synthase/aminodeoxychorismate synthase-like glutamine amidotransferase
MLLVIDNYDSFTYNLVHLIGHWTSELMVVRNDAVSIENIEQINPDGILLSPGPGRPEHAGVTESIVRRFGEHTPILGVCLGHQAIGHVYGGAITYAPTLMHGKTSQIRHDGNTIFENLEQNFIATRYHSLVVDREDLPDCLEVSAETRDGVIMGLRHRSFPVEGIQFHPESVLTREGPILMANWLQSIPTHSDSM